MVYLLIALVVLIALAPLTHFLPSKTQRHQAAMREAAAVQGLFVEFRDLPAASSADTTRSRADSVYYGLRLRPSSGRQGRARRNWLRQEGEWRPLGSRAIPPDCLQAMPAGVLAASVDEASCGVYWREDGELATVTEIRRLLGEWAQQLAA